MQKIPCRPYSSSREELPQRTSFQTAHPLRGITDLLAGENEQWAQELGQIRCIFSAQSSFGFPSMTFYHYPSDKDEEYGWRHPLEKEVFSVEPNNPMESEILHFIDLCAGRASTPRCTGEQGLASLKIINATIESAKSGKIVEIR